MVVALKVAYSPQGEASLADDRECRHPVKRSFCVTSQRLLDLLCAPVQAPSSALFSVSLPFHVGPGKPGSVDIL